MHHVSQDAASGLGYRRLCMAGGVAVFCGGAFLAGLSALGRTRHIACVGRARRRWERVG